MMRESFNTSTTINRYLFSWQPRNWWYPQTLKLSYYEHTFVHWFLLTPNVVFRSSALTYVFYRYLSCASLKTFIYRTDDAKTLKCLWCFVHFVVFNRIHIYQPCLLFFLYWIHWRNIFNYNIELSILFVYVNKFAFI